MVLPPIEFSFFEELTNINCMITSLFSQAVLRRPRFCGKSNAGELVIPPEAYQKTIQALKALGPERGAKKIAEIIKTYKSAAEQRLQYSPGPVPLMNISLILPGQEEPANIPERGQT